MHWQHMTSYVCNIMKIDCLVLTKTKIDETISSNLLHIRGYREPIRNDRNSHGGGTIVYVAQHLTSKQQHALQHDLFEHIWVDVKVCGKIYSVNALYRSSTQISIDDYQTFLSATEDILTKLQNHPTDNYVFASDLNIGNVYSKMPILAPKPLDVSAPELFQMFGYTQLIDIPTPSGLPSPRVYNRRPP